MSYARIKFKSTLPKSEEKKSFSKINPLKFFFLLLFIIAVRRSDDECKPNLTVHDYSITLLTWWNFLNYCSDKQRGISNGKVCQFENETFFLKLVEPPYDYERTDEGLTQIISLEEYNRQFVSKNLNISVPESKFFRSDYLWRSDLYIGSKRVAGLHFFSDADTAKAKRASLGEHGVAKLAVAMTFINDLHDENWGYGPNGLVLIDVDSVQEKFTSIEDHIDLIGESLLELPVSLNLNDVLMMKNIYEGMKKMSLPKFHDQLHLAHNDYLSLLDIYINACSQVLSDFASVKKLKTKGNIINVALIREIKELSSSIVVHNFQI